MNLRILRAIHTEREWEWEQDREHEWHHLESVTDPFDFLPLSMLGKAPALTWCEWYHWNQGVAFQALSLAATLSLGVNRPLVWLCARCTAGYIGMEYNRGLLLGIVRNKISPEVKKLPWGIFRHHCIWRPTFSSWQEVGTRHRRSAPWSTSGSSPDTGCAYYSGL